MRRGLPYIYGGVNVACALIVVFARLRVAAVQAREGRSYTDFGDGLEFFMVVGPTLVLGLVTNAAWLVKSLRDIARHQSYTAFRWFRGCTALWVVTLLGTWLL